MKRLTIINYILISYLLVFLAEPSAYSINPYYKNINIDRVIANSISGQVFDPFNHPVSNLDVELLNENSFAVARSRTSSGGRYSFNNMTGGNYKVKILTFGTDYLEQIQEVQVVNVALGTSDQQFLDFHLKFDSRKIVVGSDGIPDEVFVQTGITDEARKHYKKGIGKLAEKNDEGLIELEAAIKIFPDYYDALVRLGEEYVQHKEFRKSFPYLIKSIDINRRSYRAFYNLGYACYQLRQLPEAVEAFRGAAILKPASINAQLLYGTVLRLSGSYGESEKALLTAGKLSKAPLPPIHYQLALIYNRLGRNNEAADQLEIFLKIQPDAPDKKEIRDLISKLRNTAK